MAQSSHSATRVDDRGGLSLDGCEILFDRAVFCSMISALAKAFTYKSPLVHFDVYACNNPIQNTRSFFGRSGAPGSAEGGGCFGAGEAVACHCDFEL